MRSINVLIFIAFLPSCTPLYHAKSLQSRNFSPTYQASHENVTLSVAPLARQDAEFLFGNRGKRLIRKRKPVRILHVHVQNNRSNSITIDPEHISLKLMSVANIAHRLHSHPGRRLATLITASALIVTISYISAAYLTIIGAVAQNSALIKTGYGLLAGSGLYALLTPLVGYAHIKQARSLNQRIDKDIKEKFLHASCLIAPQEECDFLLCTSRKAYHPCFSMIFTDQSLALQIPFSVTVSSKGDTNG